MNNLYYSQEHAKVCSGQNCIHVYDDTARILNIIAVIVSMAIAAALLQQVLK